MNYCNACVFSLIVLIHKGKGQEQIPSEPSEFKGEAISETSVCLSWAAPSHGDSDNQISGYELVYWRSGEAEEAEKTKVSLRPTTSHFLKNLTPSSTYTFQLAARSKHGLGAYTSYSIDMRLKIDCRPEITVKEGSDVILQYKTHPPVNVNREVVEWRRNSKIVHARRKGGEDPAGKDPAFKGRTEIFPDDMGNGKLSLKISNVMKDDEGIYFVNYTKTLSKCSVTVTIEKKADEKITGDTDNNVFPWLLSAIGAIIALVLIVGCILWERSLPDTFPRPNLLLEHLCRAPGNEDEQPAGNVPLQDLGPPAPQNDDINGEREPLQQDNGANPQLQEDGN